MATTSTTKPCGLCRTTTYDAPCVSASGRHWTSLDDDDSPMPAALAAALTAPEHRTGEQATLIAADAAAHERKQHRHDVGRDGFPSADACARRSFLSSLEGLGLPQTAQTCYGEVVDVNRYIEWLLDQDAPTLAVLTALIDTASAPHNQ